MIEDSSIGDEPQQWGRSGQEQRVGSSRVKSSRFTVAQSLAKSKLQWSSSASSDRDRGSISLACTLYAAYAEEGTRTVSRAGTGLKYCN